MTITITPADHKRFRPFRVSVLIVAYHSATTIEACIGSLIPQLDEVNGEVIVVDNHSTDETVSKLEQLAQHHDRIVLLLNSVNRGFALGNNQALEQAQGQQILVLNPDTVLSPGVLAGLLDRLEADPDIGGVAPQLRFPDGRIHKTCRRFPRHMDVVYNTLGLTALYPRSRRYNGWKMGDFDHRTRRQVDQPAGAALLIKGRLLRKLGGFDENFPMFFNDVDLCKRIADAGYKIWFYPEFIIEHLGGGSVNQVKTKMIISSHVSFFRYFEKHFTRLHQQPMNFLAGVLLYGALLPRILLSLAVFGNSPRKRDTL